MAARPMRSRNSAKIMAGSALHRNCVGFKNWRGLNSVPPASIAELSKGQYVPVVTSGISAGKNMADIHRLKSSIISVTAKPLKKTERYFAA